MAEEPLFNTVTIASLLATAVMAILSYYLADKLGRKCNKIDKMVLFWLVWDAMIHFSLEGPFVFLSLTGTVENSSHWAAETWKEYGKADRRWLVSDPTIVSLEILTVVLDGLFCLILIHAIIHNKYYRHWIQLVLCTCELYGGWMTFCPEWLTGSPNLVTSNALYLWVYLVFFNGLWVVVPLALMYQSWEAMKEAFTGSTGPKTSSSGRYNMRTKKAH